MSNFSLNDGKENLLVGLDNVIKTTTEVSNIKQSKELREALTNLEDIRHQIERKCPESRRTLFSSNRR